MPGGQHDVAESTHGDEGGPVDVVWGHPPVLDEQVVQRDDHLSVHRRPAVRIGGNDNDVAVQPHVEPVVLSHVGVVPVEALIRTANLVDEVATDGDWCLCLVRHTVVPVVEPESMPMHGGLDFSLVVHSNRDL